MTASRAIVGSILAGGLGRRMGGVDKGLIDLGGRSLLAHVVERVRPQVGALFLSANGDPSRFASLGLPVIADQEEGYPGPLAGIVAALDTVARLAPEAASLLSVPCDTPFLPLDLVGRLDAARLGAGAPGAVAMSGGRRHPTVALWPVSASETIREALQGGERRVAAVSAALGFVAAEWPSEPFDPFFNVNDPAGLGQALHLLGRSPAR
jgi:molybdenum cofactor guanylyltransferase